ncbi:hypothetical protein VOLCADRAFT_88330 [Volvox carteri f. nagariensis]|uniref:Uncharacterized protein n=1 Tax=Volvox carteri f. nagariensis TaxID=3068 RepID=D8TNX0_VOLCA|nr:uncharacterized protein VOLCADRAFT_88330 [Volvox carteri f. nagariensis]EFJ50916.1 hypothetical protein VOLCADRAFT_88330 [Volvox carteri f. nagariensis]|eukprot:XP_002947928.1 hypothetical protein VOLCADRAFT_88330 [Volvox carteri f. nagariensis]
MPRRPWAPEGYQSPQKIEENGHRGHPDSDYGVQYNNGYRCIQRFSGFCTTAAVDHHHHLHVTQSTCLAVSCGVGGGIRSTKRVGFAVPTSTFSIRAHLVQF